MGQCLLQHNKVWRSWFGSISEYGSRRTLNHKIHIQFGSGSKTIFCVTCVKKTCTKLLMSEFMSMRSPLEAQNGIIRLFFILHLCAQFNAFNGMHLTQIWDKERCSCRCRAEEWKECNTGFSYDGVYTCQCLPGTLSTRVGNSIIGYSIESLIFCDKKIDWILKKIELLQSIFFKDRRDQFAHGLSFLKIEGIDLLTVNIFKRSRGSIRTILIFVKDRGDRFTHGRSF